MSSDGRSVARSGRCTCRCTEAHSHLCCKIRAPKLGVGSDLHTADSVSIVPMYVCICVSKSQQESQPGFSEGRCHKPYACWLRVIANRLRW